MVVREHQVEASERKIMSCNPGITYGHLHAVWKNPFYSLTRQPPKVEVLEGRFLLVTSSSGIQLQHLSLAHANK